MRWMRAALRAPVLSATSRMERSWIMAGLLGGLDGWKSGFALGLDRRFDVPRGLRRHGRGNIGLADRGAFNGDGLLQDRDDTPALQPADGTGLHDLNLVANLGFILLVVDVKDGLAVDDLMVKGVDRKSVV